MPDGDVGNGKCVLPGQSVLSVWIAEMRAGPLVKIDKPMTSSEDEAPEQEASAPARNKELDEI